jgi:hypothetical protein
MAQPVVMPRFDEGAAAATPAGDPSHVFRQRRRRPDRARE